MSIVVDEKGNLSWYIGTLLALFFSKGGAKFSDSNGVHQLIVPDGGGENQVVQCSWKRSGAARGREQDVRRQQHCFGFDGGSRTIRSSRALAKGLYEGSRYTRCVLNCTPQGWAGRAGFAPVRPHQTHSDQTLQNKAFLQIFGASVV